MIARRTPIKGNGSEKSRCFSGLDSPAIAHKELSANARFVTFDGAARDFPGNRAPAHWKFIGRPKEKICAQAKGRASSDKAAHRFDLKQQR